MGSSSAERFFEDRQLDAARAISARDMKQLQHTTQGLDLNLPGKTEMTLLWFAIQEKNFDAIRFLVQHGSDPTKQVVQGVGIPIDYALLSKDARILSAILDGGFSANHVNQWGTTLLHKAAGEGDSLAQVKLLVERGAKLDAKDSLGDTAISEAIAAQQPDRARYLLEQGASLKTYSTRGATPANTVQNILARLKPDSELYRQFDELRNLMILHGAKFPAEDAETVRAWMKSQGMRVVE